MFDRNARTVLKRRVTTALRDAGFSRSTETTDGFDYGDERGKNSISPIDRDNPERVGLILTFKSRSLWRFGKYAEANRRSQARNYTMAAALVEAGFKLTVKQNHANDPGHIVLWADENLA